MISLSLSWRTLLCHWGTRCSMCLHCAPMPCSLQSAHTSVTCGLILVHVLMAKEEL